jgi:hypothetical protein
MTGGRSEQQMADIVTRKMKDLHLEIAKRWGIPSQVLAGTTFGLGVTMMAESGYSAEQIVEIVHQILGDLGAPPEVRGTS